MPASRIVQRIPLDYLWNDAGDIEARRGRRLSKAELRELLRSYPVEFYVADIGSPLRRVDVARCFGFWKSEVEPHLVDHPNCGFRLEDFPSGYAYVASEWSGEIQTPIVLLEKYH